MRLAALSALALAGCALTPSPPMDAAATLAAAETAFAAQSVREDMRAAFLANFAPDGVFIRDGWANVAEALARDTAPPIVLDWKPVYTEVAQSGDLGLSTGPWKLTSKDKPDAPARYGQFVSIWRREANRWRVVVDIGISHPEPTLWNERLDTMVLGGRTALTRGGIETAELEFVTDAHLEGLPAAYDKHAAPALRLYREGHPPAIGKHAALASPAMSARKLAWTIDRTEMARSRDFGYSRGSYADVATPKVPLGYFMRVWHVEGGQWRIALDVAQPVAKP